MVCFANDFYRWLINPNQAISLQISKIFFIRFERRTKYRLRLRLRTINMLRVRCMHCYCVWNGTKKRNVLLLVCTFFLGNIPCSRCSVKFLALAAIWTRLKIRTKTRNHNRNKKTRNGKNAEKLFVNSDQRH